MFFYNFQLTLRTFKETQKISEKNLITNLLFWQQVFPMDVSYNLAIFTSMKDFLSKTRAITKMASVYKSCKKTLQYLELKTLNINTLK